MQAIVVIFCNCKYENKEGRGADSSWCPTNWVGYDLGPSSLAKKDGNKELKQKSMTNSDELT